MSRAQATSATLPMPASRRLDFRPVATWDVPEIVALHRDPRVTALLVDDVPDDLVKAHLVVAWNVPFAARGFGTFGVRRQGERRLIGLFSLTPFEGDEDLLELGGKLHPSAWVGGLALEAGQAMIAHAFGSLNRDHLVSAIDPAQRSAAAALRRLGFVDYGEGPLFGRTVTRFELTFARWQERGNRPTAHTTAVSTPRHEGVEL